MAELHIFTSAAANYLPKVRTLCASIRRHHPEARIHFALADERPAWLDCASEPFDTIVDIGSLGIDQWRAWAFKHDIVELSTAIKPFVLRRLLAIPGCRKVLYFDPDMVLFSRVDDILAALEERNIALTPHQNKPERSIAAIIDNEIGSLKWGIFNLGFIGVANTPEGLRFTDWWAERAYHFCRAEVANGLFTDQKWINHVPVFFDGVEIVKSSRHNVATWNLTTRALSGDAQSGFRVDGDPLAFYHFTGFDSGAHRIMALKNASGNASVQSLIEWYERETAPQKDDPVSRLPWAFARFSDGTPIESGHRWLYRERSDLQAAYPDPFDAEAGKPTLLQWFQTEGQARYPELFGKGAAAPTTASQVRSGVSVRTALRLAALLLSPYSGQALRARLARILRTEGLGGVTRRLRGHHG